MKNHLVITVIADDRPGIVERLAEIITSHQGNWLESSLSRLAGKFAGIVSITLADDQLAALQAAFKQLAKEGIRITTEVAAETTSDTLPITGTPLLLTLTGNDRPGIVQEISARLARLKVNVEELQTYCESAPMTGELLFNLRASLTLPATLARDQVQDSLEDLSNDLVVEIEDQEY